jgi:hypothetical protein
MMGVEATHCTSNPQPGRQDTAIDVEGDALQFQRRHSLLDDARVDIVEMGPCLISESFEHP